MHNSGLPEINAKGEKHVEIWLTENGYSDVSFEKLSGIDKALKATGNIERIIVLVRTVLHPHRPLKLSDYEADFLTRRAIMQKLVAYAAYVILDENGNVLGEINWDRLS